MSDSTFSRRELTFEQAEGFAALPAQLSRDTISGPLRAKLWDVFYRYGRGSSINDAFGYAIAGNEFWIAYKSLRVGKYGTFADELSNRVSKISDDLKPLFQSKDHAVVLGTVEWLTRRLQKTWVPKAVERILIEERAAYRLVDEHDIVPLASAEEGRALLNAFNQLEEAGFIGARTHLKLAASAVSSGKYADCVRESMQAIESASRSIAGTSKFSDALTEIEKSHRLHRALKNGLLSLYGYSSDEEGVRHPLLENGDANVSEADALLMLGICSAAITYLVAKP